jgi:hypothetical protein
VVLSELIVTVTGPCAVVKVKMLPLILLRVPLVRWWCVEVGGKVGVGIDVWGVAGAGLGAGAGGGVGAGVAAGAQEATTISNRTTSKVADDMNRCFIVLPPNYCSFYFSREDNLHPLAFHIALMILPGTSRNPFIVHFRNHNSLIFNYI